MLALSLVLQSLIGPPSQPAPPPPAPVASPWHKNAAGGQTRFLARWNGTKFVPYGEQHRVKLTDTPTVFTADGSEDHPVYFSTSTTTFNVPQYNGSLSEVDMIGTVGFFDVFKVESLNPETDEDFYWGGGSSGCTGSPGTSSWHKVVVTVSDLPKKWVNETFNIPDHHYHCYGGYDGITDYAGTSGDAYYPNDFRDVDPAQRVTSQTYLGEFEGTGNATFTVTRTQSWSFCNAGGAGYQNEVHMAVDGDLEFTYLY